jgi:hypothetical protein
MWEHQHLTALWASIACYRDTFSFTLFFFYYFKRIIAAVKKVEFVNDTMLCITLRGHWSDIIVLNVQVTKEDKIDGMKESF